MKTINLEEILKNQCKITYEIEGVTRYFSFFERSIIIKAMKEGCKQTLELASENVDNVIEKSEEDIHIVLAQEINNSILDTINNLDTINSIK